MRTIFELHIGNCLFIDANSENRTVVSGSYDSTICLVPTQIEWNIEYYTLSVPGCVRCEEENHEIRINNSACVHS